MKKTNLACVALSLILGFSMGWFMKPVPVPAKIELIQEENDPPPVQIKSIPAKITYENSDGLESNSKPTAEDARTFGISGVSLERIPKYADMDTTFGDGERLQVRYHFPPINKFDVMRDLPAPKIIVKTEYIPYKPKFWQTQKAGFVAGIAATAIVIYLVK